MITGNPPYTIRFCYGGTVRVVANPNFKATSEGHNVVVGFELTKGDEGSGSIKSYRLDRIESPIETVVTVKA